MSQRALLIAALCSASCIDLGAAPWEVAEREPGLELGPGTPDPGSPGPTGTSTAADPCAGAAPRQVEVLLIANSFRPALLQICAGDTVVWRNRDTKEHTVYTGTPESPTGIISTATLFFDETHTHTFDVAGSYFYYCSTHKKQMRDARIDVR